MALFNNAAPVCDPRRLLIVDDEQAVRKVFAMIVGSYFPDIQTEQACNGLEAVRLFQQNRHGVILMDLRMPEMDGIQAFSAIEEQCRKDGIPMPPVVFCTGFASPEAITRIVVEGSRHCLLRKPPNSEQITRAIAASLQFYSATPAVRTGP